MARRKKVTIKIQRLKCFGALYAELSSYPELKGYDLATLELTVMGSYTPAIANLHQKIANLSYYIASNGDILATKQQLCRSLRVSRPTLDKWIIEGFINDGTTTESSKLRKFFQLSSVLEQLQNEYNKKE